MVSGVRRYRDRCPWQPPPPPPLTGAAIPVATDSTHHSDRRRAGLGTFSPPLAFKPSFNLLPFLQDRPCGKSMLMQCHDHYNSHGDGSDAYTVTLHTDDELSESGRLRNKLNM